LGLSDTVTSVGWSVKGPLFSLGTNNGELHLWDLNKMKRVRNMNGHTDRIASISWNNDTISTGSRDKTILQRDPRAKGSFFTKLTHHKQ
jgi:cell division cycle 20-like protein 1 (cofactor of APC complex)